MVNGEKKRILFINGHMQSGGVERALLSILENIDFSIFEVSLLLIEQGEDFISEIPKEVKVIHKPLDGSFIGFTSLLLSVISKRSHWSDLKFRIFWELAPYTGDYIFRYFRKDLGLERDYDAVIAFRPGLSTKLASITKSSKKIAWWHHGCMHDEIKVRKRLIRDWQSFDNVVTVSEGVADILRGMSSELGAKVKVINNIVDSYDIIEKGDAESDVFSSDKFNIISVSRLVIEKKFEIIPTIATILKGRGVEFKWHIVGEGPRREIIEREIEKQDVADVVILHGNKINPYPWIKTADLMVHVSPVESFGLVLTEAMALGTPCIAVESAGSREILNQTNGLRVKLYAEEIAEAIIDLVKNPDKLASIREEGLKSVQTYSPRVIMPKIYALFD